MAVVLERRYVWETPVRVAHWVIVLCILALCATGWYIHDPFLKPGEHTMATARLVHLLCGFAFTAALMVRAYWFLAGNRYARWRAFVLGTPRQWRGLVQTLQHYAFLRREPYQGVGHNPLAATIYAGLYVLMALEAFTGMVLYARGAEHDTWHALFGWPVQLMSEQNLRLLHFGLMFLFLAFLMNHLYLVVLLAREERNGLVDSIVTGWKFIRVEDGRDPDD